MGSVPRRATPLLLMLAVAVALAGCGPDAPAATPPISPGTAAAPREVNIIAREYSFQPPVIDFVPGETVLIHVVNAGLEVHEVVIGDMAVQDAWEAAEAATIGAPPGPTPVVSVPPGLEGLRVVVRSGERADVTWSVPAAPPPGATPPAILVGCHIPGHWAKGMLAPVRLITPGG